MKFEEFKQGLEKLAIEFDTKIKQSRIEQLYSALSAWSASDWQSAVEVMLDKERTMPKQAMMKYYLNLSSEARRDREWGIKRNQEQRELSDIGSAREEAKKNLKRLLEGLEKACSTIESEREEGRVALAHLAREFQAEAVDEYFDSDMPTGRRKEK